MRSRAALLTLLLVFCTAAARAQQPPAELEWRNLPEIKARVLVPRGWFLTADSPMTATKKVYRITKEKPAKDGHFETGLTLTVAIRAKGEPAEAQARRFVEEGLAHGEVRQPFFEEEAGSMKGFGGVVRGGKYTTALNAIATPATNTLYTMTFQSPNERFDEEWKLGAWMIGRFALDDEV